MRTPTRNPCGDCGGCEMCGYSEPKMCINPNCGNTEGENDVGLCDADYEEYLVALLNWQPIAVTPCSIAGCLECVEYELHRTVNGWQVDEKHGGTLGVYPTDRQAKIAASQEELLKGRK